MKENLKIISAPILASAIALSGSGEATAHDHEEEVYDPVYQQMLETRTAGELARYKFPLETVKEHVDIESNEDLASLMDKVTSDPKAHVEIIDPLSAKTYNYGDNWVYNIYSEPPNEDADIDDWYIQIRMNDTNNLQEYISINIKYENSKELNNPQDEINNLEQIDAISMGTKSTNIFKIPEEMEFESWFLFTNEEGNVSWYQKTYIDPENPDLAYFQILTQPNIINYTIRTASEYYK